MRGYEVITLGARISKLADQPSIPGNQWSRTKENIQGTYTAKIAVDGRTNGRKQEVGAGERPCQGRTSQIPALNLPEATCPIYIWFHYLLPGSFVCLRAREYIWFAEWTLASWATCHGIMPCSSYYSVLLIDPGAVLHSTALLPREAYSTHT